MECSNIICLAWIVLENKEDGTCAIGFIQETLATPVVRVMAHSDKQGQKKATTPYGVILKPIDEHGLFSAVHIALFKSKHGLSPASKVVQGNKLMLGEGYAYDLIQHHLYKKNSAIALTKKERLLIGLLLDHLNTVVPYAKIMHVVWEGKPAAPETLRSLVRRLRQKLGHEVVQTVASLGHKISV